MSATWFVVWPDLVLVQMPFPIQSGDLAEADFGGPGKVSVGNDLGAGHDAS